MYTYIYIYIPIGCLIFIGHCPQNSPIIRGSFAENDLQLKASYGSSPPCISHESHITIISAKEPIIIGFFCEK